VVNGVVWKDSNLKLSDKEGRYGMRWIQDPVGVNPVRVQIPPPAFK